MLILKGAEMTNTTQTDLLDGVEPAPENGLPTWDDCQLIIENFGFRQKAEAGLEGQVLDTPQSTPNPTELHRFIYEYDDADPYRSAWFMHRLEALLEANRKQVLLEAADKLDAAFGGNAGIMFRSIVEGANDA
jgi:hypothetical protein